MQVSPWKRVCTVFVHIWNKMFQDIWQRHGEHPYCYGAIFLVSLGWKLSGHCCLTAGPTSGMSGFCIPALCRKKCPSQRYLTTCGLACPIQRRILLILIKARAQRVQNILYILGFLQSLKKVWRGPQINDWLIIPKG